jgi:hypothetical protein
MRASRAYTCLVSASDFNAFFMSAAEFTLSRTRLHSTATFFSCEIDSSR